MNHDSQNHDSQSGLPNDPRDDTPSPAERDGAELLAYLVDDDTLDADRRAEIEARLASDPAFREEKELLEATLGALRANAAESSSTLDTTRRAALLEASRAASATNTAHATSAPARVVAPVWQRVAAVAAIAVVAGLGWHVWKRGDAPSPTPGEAGSLATSGADAPAASDANDGAEPLDVALRVDLRSHVARVEGLSLEAETVRSGRRADTRGVTTATATATGTAATAATRTRGGAETTAEPIRLAREASGPAALPGPTWNRANSIVEPGSGAGDRYGSLELSLDRDGNYNLRAATIETLADGGENKARPELPREAGAATRAAGPAVAAGLDQAAVPERAKTRGFAVAEGEPAAASQGVGVGGGAARAYGRREVAPEEASAVARGELGAGGYSLPVDGFDAFRRNDSGVVTETLEQPTSGPGAEADLETAALGERLVKLREEERRSKDFGDDGRVQLARRPGGLTPEPGVDGVLDSFDDRLLLRDGAASAPAPATQPDSALPGDATSPADAKILPPGSVKFDASDAPASAGDARRATRTADPGLKPASEPTRDESATKAPGETTAEAPATTPADPAGLVDPLEENAPAESDAALTKKPAPPSEAELLEARRQAVRAQIDAYLARLDRQQGESPSAMFYRYWGDNAFVETESDRLSTFAVDVDTASYTLLRKQLYSAGSLPPSEAIRTEEMVNYFRGDDAPPADGAGAFAIHSEIAPSVFGHQSEYKLLRIAVKAREVERKDRKACSLVFVIDTSGSMRQGNRLELVKEALLLLVAELDEGDLIGIVAFDRESRIILEPTPAAEKERITSAIASLHPRANTNVEAGLRDGYALAAKAFIDQGVNRVLLLSDGVANAGITNAEGLLQTIAAERQRGVYLTTVGVGMGNHNDHLLEQLADRGDGQCVYVDRLEEAKKVFVDNLTGTLETVARDVKIQVEFDPKQVVRYRQLGYENRVVADADFRNNKVDAGEVGAGHCVTALYEVRLADAVAADDTKDPATTDEASTTLATVRVRYLTLDPRPAEGGGEAVELEHTVDRRILRASFDEASPTFRLHASVAEFAEILRDSFWARGSTIRGAIEIAESLLTSGAIDGERATDVAELVALMKRADPLVEARHAAEDEVAQVIDALKENRWLHARIEAAEALGRAETRQYLDDLRSQNQALRGRLERLLVP